MRKLPVYYLEWVDSASCRGWTEVERIDPSPKVCRSIGFLVMENKEVITIAGHFSDNPDLCNGDITIPKVAIIKRKKITY
jgi:hypothetical protein